MVIEDFDFDEFFSEDKKYLQAKNTYYCGVGCVIFITDNQTVIRWNDSLVDSNGNLEKGLGYHPQNLRGIASDILGGSNDEKEQTKLMNNSIFFLMTNCDLPNSIVHIPSFVTTNQLNALEYIRDKIKASVGNEEFNVYLDAVVEDDEIVDLDYLYEKAKLNLDNNHKVDFNETIVVKNVINAGVARTM